MLSIGGFWGKGLCRVVGGVEGVAGLRGGVATERWREELEAEWACWRCFRRVPNFLKPFPQRSQCFRCSSPTSSFSGVDLLGEVA